MLGLFKQTYMNISEEFICDHIKHLRTFTPSFKVESSFIHSLSNIVERSYKGYFFILYKLIYGVRKNPAYFGHSFETANLTYHMFIKQLIIYFFKMLGRTII